MNKMLIYFIIDKSVKHSSIDDVTNNALEELLPELLDIQEFNIEAELNIRTMVYNVGARWLEEAPVNIKEYNFDKLKMEECFGTSDFGEACYQLSKVMTVDSVFGEKAVVYQPLIFFITNNNPSDDYLYGMNKLKNSECYKCCQKVFILMGDNTNKTLYKELTDSNTEFISIYTSKSLKEFIKFINIHRNGSVCTLEEENDYSGDANSVDWNV